MIQLIKKNINTAKEYDRIYRKRSQGEYDPFDARRWWALLSRFKGGRIVDLGCLDSLIPVWAKHRYTKSDVWGIDQAKWAIINMKYRYPDINFENRDIYRTKFPDGYFSYAVLGEVLEHLTKPRLAVKEAMRILKPGGTLAVSVPLDEAKEPGAVDKDHHMFSFDELDMEKLLSPYGKIEMEVLRSRQEPYEYCFPQLIAFCKKHGS